MGWVSASKVSRCVNLFGDLEFGSHHSGGIAFGVLSVGPAIFFSAAFMWRSHNEFFAVTALVSGAFAVIAPFVFFLL